VTLKEDPTNTEDFYARQSNKLFHIAAAPPSVGFARSVSKTPLQRFHSIIVGSAAKVAGFRMRPAGTAAHSNYS
jgi:hypothetical protein